jgi:hypothetical protein
LKKLLDALNDILDSLLPRPEEQPDAIPVPVRVNDRPARPPRR